MSDPALNLPIKSTFDASGTDAAARALQQLQQAQAKAVPKPTADPYKGVDQSAANAEKATLRYASALASAQKATGDTAGAVETMKGALSQMTPNTLEAHQATVKLSSAQSALQKELAGGASFAQEFGASLSGAFESMLGPAAAAGAAIAAVGKAAELVKLGAQAEQTEARFNSLAQAAGMAGDVLLAAMRKASGGTISDLNLQLAANRAQLLGVAHSAEEFGTLMAIARDRAQQMGTTTTDAFNDIVTGLGRGSKLILDNLGIIVNAEEANKAYAASIGKTAAALTDEEKKQALINQVLADGKKTIEETGGAVETTATKLERASTAIDNAKESLGRLLALKVAPFADDLVKVADALTGIGSAADGLKGGLDFSSRIGPTVTVMNLLQGAADGAIHKMNDLAGTKFPDIAVPAKASASALGAFFSAAFQGKNGFVALNEAGRASEDALQGEAEAARRAAVDSRQLAGAQAHLADEHREAAQAAAEYQAAQNAIADGRAEAIQATHAIGDYGAALLDIRGEAMEAARGTQEWALRTEEARKAMSAIAKEGPAAFGQALATQTDFAAKLVDIQAKAEDKIASLTEDRAKAKTAKERAAIDERIAAVQAGADAELATQAEGFAKEEAAQKEHLGKMLIEYAQAQAALHGVSAEATKQFTDDIARRFGVVPDLAQSAFGAAQQDAQNWAASGGQNADAYAAHIAAVVDQAAELDRKMNEAIKDRSTTFELVNKGKLTPEQLADGLAQIRTQVVTEFQNNFPEGMARAQELKGSIDQIEKQIRIEEGDNMAIGEARADALSAKITAIPKTPQVTVTDNLAMVAAHANDAERAIAAIPKQTTVTVTTVFNEEHRMSEHAGKAVGGPVDKGETYIVGEHGPEMFTPGASGNITPADQTRMALGGGGGGGGGGQTAARSRSGGGSGSVDRLAQIYRDAGKKLEEIEANTMQKLLDIDQKYAEQRLEQQRDFQDDMARTNAQTNFDQQLNDFDKFNKNMSADQQRALAEREKAEVVYNEKIAKAQEEAKKIAADGDAEYAKDYLAAKTKQAEQEREVDEKSSEAMRNVKKKQRKDVQAEADQAKAAAKAEADTDIAIAQAKAQQRAQAQQAEKDAVYAEAEDQKNKVIGAAEESAAKVKGASDSQKATVIANLKAQADAVKMWSDTIVSESGRAQSAMDNVHGPSTGGGGTGEGGEPSGEGGMGGEGFAGGGRGISSKAASGGGGGTVEAAIQTLNDAAEIIKVIKPFVAANKGAVKLLNEYSLTVKSAVASLVAIRDLRERLIAPAPVLDVNQVIALKNDIERVLSLMMSIDATATSKVRVFAKYLETEKAAIDILNSVMELRQDLSRPTPPITPGYVLELVATANAVISLILSQLIPLKQREVDGLKTYADASGAAFGILKDVADLRKDLADQANIAPFDMNLIRGLVRRAADITRMVQDALVPMTEQTAAGFDAYATAAGAAISIIKDTADLRKELSDQKDVSPFNMALISGLARRAREITQLVLAQLIPLTEAQADGFSRYADTAGKAVQILKDTADLRKELSSAELGAIDVRVIQRLAADARRITDTVVGSMAPMSEETAAAAQRFADTEGAAVAAIKNVLELPAKMFTDYRSPSDAQINRVVADAKRIADRVNAAAATYSTDGLEAGKAFAEGIGATFTAFKDGLLFFEALNSGDFRLDPKNLAAFEQGSKAVMQTAARLGAQAATIPAGDIAALQSVTAALSDQAEMLIKLAAVPFGNLPNVASAYGATGGGTTNTFNNTFVLPMGSTQQIAKEVISIVQRQIGARR